jgi:lipopolysaccharide transport system permease protein
MKYQSSLFSLAQSVFVNRDLVLQLTKRNILLKYRGSLLGFFWSFLQPIIQLAIYTFAFSFVFKAKWGIVNENHFDFALILFASLTVFNLLGESMRDAPYLILNHASYVKKVVFPLELLPVTSVLTVLFNTMISIVIFLLIFGFLGGGAIPNSIFMLPLILIPLVLLSIAVSFFISSLCVYFRDISQVVGNAITILLFVSPVFYSIDRISLKYQWVLLLNPLSHILDISRKVMIFGGYPQLSYIAAYWLLSILFLALGYWWFQRTRVSFADLI